MAKSPTFTFKKYPRTTGLAGTGYPNQSVRIKYRGKMFGIIHAPNWTTNEEVWTLSIAVTNNPTTENPCPWKWVFFTNKFESEEAARLSIKGHAAKILSTYPLHFFEED